MTQPSNLGIIGYDSIRFVSLDLERSRDFYINKLDFALTAATTPAFEDRVGYKGLVFSARNINIEVVESTREGSYAAKHLKQHAAGISAVSYLVKDIEHARKTLAARGATLMDTKTEVIEEAGGKYSSFEIATPLGNTIYRFIQRDNMKLHAPGWEARQEGGSNKFDFAGIDHLTSNMRTLKPYIAWFKEVMGMEEFWRIDFHTSDIDPTRTSGSGLRSIVVRDPESGIKFANNEPAAPFFNNSQIQFYLEDFGGPGIQHAAFGIRDILGAIDELRQRGARFLPTPSSYYDAAPTRMAEQGVPKIDEDWAELRRTSTLIDGKDGKYLLQIFMEEAAKLYGQPKAGPFFIELIQRKGDPGFGGGNFRALFESIEREQADRIAAAAAAKA
jgi:4-hydroxyphenylpyruvate dioxygenase